jgi:Spy/CpxP family protein refolding chaperone
MRSAARYMAAGLMAVAAVGLSTAQDTPRQRPGGGFGGPGGGGGGIMSVAGNKAVQEEVKITDEQKEKLTEAGKKIRETMMAKMKDVPRDQFREKMASIQADVNKEAETALAEVLKPEQVTRIKQISVQSLGLRAFTNEAVVTALKLTDDQKAQIKEIADEAQKDSRDLFEAAGIKPGERPDADKMEALRKKTEIVRKDAFEKAAKALTAEQKETWKTLTGEPFDTSKLTPAGFGGRGGPGGNRPPQNNN